MEFFPSYQMTGMACIFGFLLSLYYVLRRSNSSHPSSRKNISAPEVAGAWPFIGHLQLLGGPQLPHITLGNMADKYGPIFTIRLGVHRALVVSSWEMAKECFTTNDKIFSSRPQVVAVELLGYDSAMFGLSTYGPYWRDMRKLVVLELLSNHRLATFSHVQEFEIKASMKHIYDRWVKNKSDSNQASMEMKTWFGGLTLNLISRIVVGKRTETKMMPFESDQSKRALRQFFELMGVFTVSDALPYLRWLDIGGYEKAMKKTAKDLDQVLQGWLEEHKERKKSGEMKDEQDFMDVMLSVLDQINADEVPKYTADTINKATCLSLILAGTDTTTVTLTWALSLLLNNHHALKKVQDELDFHVGRERKVKQSDLKNLAYLQAIIKETLRLYPATQLTPPRESMEDCIVGSYHVPTGTRLFLNLWKIHRDPRVWKDPLEFQPERFLTTHKDVDVRGQHFELLPFGSGRRACPGISFGLQVAEFVLASFLHEFEVATPTDEPVDMTESFGLTNVKATALEVLLSARLSPVLYE